MFNIFPPKRDFFKMLLGQAEKVQDGLSLLLRFLHETTDDNAQAVNRAEKEADELRRVVIDELNHTFVTPIDREDIFRLSRAIDDIMDYADTTAEEMTLFGISPDQFIVEMVELLYAAAKDINLAVRELNQHPGVCAEHLVRARRAENLVERAYRRGLVELFKTNDVIRILKTREVYRHLSNAADRVVESANIIGDILVKTS